MSANETRLPTYRRPGKLNIPTKPFFRDRRTQEARARAGEKRRAYYEELKAEHREEFRAS